MGTKRHPVIRTLLPGPHCPPEYRLLAAVIEEAVRDVFIDSRDTWRKKGKAYSWIFDGDADDDTPFTFGWICLMLNASARHVRSNIRRMMRENFNVRDVRQVHRTESGVAAWLYEAA